VNNAITTYVIISTSRLFWENAAPANVEEITDGILARAVMQIKSRRFIFVIGAIYVSISFGVPGMKNNRKIMDFNFFS
jgi:hypothetical protein